MRNKALLLALTVVVACGAGPFRGGFLRSAAPVGPVFNSTPIIGRSAQGAILPRGPVAGPQAAMAQGRESEVAQVSFKGVDGMTIQWDASSIGAFDSDPVVCPAAQNFQTARSYRLKLANIPNRENVILYPTLTINAVSPRTKAYLDHNSIPVKFSEADFEQVANGNFVTKVIFLPSQKYQNLALAGGVDTIVNTQLPAGADPIVEAQNRGAILAVVQIGNKDLALDGSYEAAAQSGANIPSQQIPISGVNVPAFGTPAPQSSINAAEIPTVPLPKSQPVLQNLDPMPSTGVPSVLETTWDGSKF